MRVKFVEECNINSIPEIYWNDINFSDFDKSYSGDLVGTTKSFWGDTYAQVLCDDGKLREIHISKINKE